MKLLVIGHSLVIDANRKFWSAFAERTGSTVDVIAPLDWSSNLSRVVEFKPNPVTDGRLRRIFPLPVHRKGNGSFFFFSPFDLWKILRSETYDAIYLNQETWALATLEVIFFKLLSRNRKTKLFLCVAQNIKKQKLRFLHPYERFVSRFVHRFLYCSKGVKDVLHWKGIRTDCAYFPLPFDDDSYRVTPVIPGSILRLGYLGRLSEDKGVHLLLRAMDIINRDGIKVMLVAGGNGPLVEAVQIRKDVEYHGLVPHNEAHLFYQLFDCFVLPSQTRPHWKEQFGRVIVEAFAAGRPVIGSSSGSIPEVLEKLHWPWVFHEDSVEDLVNLIEKIGPYLRSPAGEAALKYAVALNQKHFSQSEVALALVNDLR